MLRENLQDAGEIVQNILTQPLSISGAEENITLLKAAQNFNASDPLSSDLRKIVLSFLEFPEPTETMLRELELILEDINV